MRKIAVKKELEYHSKKIITLWFIMLKLRGLLPIKKNELHINLNNLDKSSNDQSSHLETKDEKKEEKKLRLRSNSLNNKCLSLESVNTSIIKRSKSLQIKKIDRRPFKVIKKIKQSYNNVPNNQSIFRKYKVDDINHLRSKPFFTEMIRRFGDLINKRKEIYKLYTKESFANDEDRLIDLDYGIYNELESIKNEIKSLKTFKNKIHSQLGYQKKIIINLDQNIKLHKEQ
jgi:hypothetical protein